ncbi:MULTISPECIES: hypothetical protein [Flammeovirga]|uniref:Uncharacterized protein n=1 Tax=Flammeovirga agarivorans TaxID=2726742 RepID=A0A7X8SKW1_9BACT|nr:MULTISPECIES: hypothetical protein [Flammeovirga]NLR92113.1 hypothetical protein [Flammeovirga agarivorans]
MKDLLDIVKSGIVVLGTLGVILAGVHFGVGPSHNILQDVPQTHVYNGN